MGFSYAAEADMNFGKAEDVLGFGNDAKFKGWGVFAKAGYMLDPVNIRASFAMVVVMMTLKTSNLKIWMLTNSRPFRELMQPAALTVRSLYTDHEP